LNAFFRSNEDLLSEKTVIYVSTDFIHAKVNSCFSGDIPAEARFTERQKIVGFQLNNQTIDENLFSLKRLKSAESTGEHSACEGKNIRIKGEGIKQACVPL